MPVNPFRASAFHPATWWFVGLAMATIASLQAHWFAELLVIAVAIVFMLSFRENAPWSKSVRFYLWLGAFVVGVRLLFRIIFNSGSTDSPSALSLVELNIGGVRLLGQVSWLTIEAAATDGLRLAAIIISIGMANTLANPKRLLKSTPGALYEVATAMTVAINLAPQLIESLQRVRKARTLRGRSKGISALNSIVIPALEDTIEQSLGLAASMDARGFGRRGSLTKAQTMATRALSLGGLLLVAFATYFLLATSSQLVAIILLVLGIGSLAITIRIASARNLRTRYRRQKPGPKDFALVALAIGSVVLVVIT
ncbi:MAG: energy-coupling factor transporter transmembrane component T [Rhodoluna sp.]|nr:energy-coupling factor transporter transmembrane component T [Rhodoluna sp.]